MALAYRSQANASDVSGEATQLVISKPSGVVDGDLLVAAIVGTQYTAANPPSPNTPSGWTQRLNALANTVQANPAQNRLVVHTKIASSEPASWAWTGYTSNTAVVGIVIAVSGGAIEAPDSSDYAIPAAATATNACPTVTPTTSSDLLLTVVSGYYGTGGPSWDNGVTHIAEVGNGMATAVACGYKVLSSSSATGASTLTSTYAWYYQVNACLVFKPSAGFSGFGIPL